MRNIIGSCLVSLCLCGCDALNPQEEGRPFALHVSPAAMTDTIPLQRCVLLVTVEDEGTNGAAGPVTLAASADDALIQIEPAQVAPGAVAEITVICADSPGDAGDEGRIIPVTIRGARGEQLETATVPLTLTSHEQELVAPYAHEMLALFIPWLEENQPDLGITADTRWTGTIVTPHILVVTHYLFLSAEWEMHIYWHVMIPPYDWTGIELRRRFVETTPSVAFRIPSRSADPVTVETVAPEGTLWR